MAGGVRRRGRRGQPAKAEAELLAEAEELLAEARIKAREDEERHAHRVASGEAAWRLGKHRRGGAGGGARRRGSPSPAGHDRRSPSPDGSHQSRTLGDGILLEQTAAKRKLYLRAQSLG